MKKELGKWFMDVAKYLLTAGIIAPWITNPGQWSEWVIPTIFGSFAVSAIIGLAFLKSDDAQQQKRERNRNKNKKK